MTSFLAQDSLLLRTAISHSRRIVSAYLDPEGLPADRCLDNLLTLMFHPALDEAAAASPAQPVTPAERMQSAVAECRATLLRHFGPENAISGADCLDELIGILDAPSLVAAGRFDPILTVKALPAREKHRVAQRSRILH